MSALFLRAFLTILVALLPALASAQGSRVAARVNDDAITEFDLAQRIQFTIKTIGRNQHKEVVCEFERTMLVMRRGNQLEEAAGY